MPIPRLTERGGRVYGEVSEFNRKKIKKRWRWRLIIKICLVLMLLGFILVTGVVAYVSRDLPDPNKLTDRQVAQSTKIYDRTGTHLLYEIYQNQKRTTVELNQISPWVAKATVAVEDRLFYEHKGVRLI